MKLDPEEQIIAAALDQAELDDANERGVGARIEFGREGHARVTMTISRALVEKATTLNWSTGELFAEAIRIALPGAFLKWHTKGSTKHFGSRKQIASVQR